VKVNKEFATNKKEKCRYFGDETKSGIRPEIAAWSYHAEEQ
jgi:hypothetical protein